MNRLSLAALGLLISSAAQAAPTPPPHPLGKYSWEAPSALDRCDLEWINSLEKAVAGNLPKSKIDKYDERMELRPSGTVMIKEGADVCEKEIWAYLKTVPKLEQAANVKLADQIKVLRAVTEAFWFQDKAAANAMAGADAVLKVAGQLKLGTYTAGVIDGAAAPGSAKASVDSKISNPSFVTAAGPIYWAGATPSSDEKKLIDQLVGPGVADKPGAGSLVQEFHKAVIDWQMTLKKLSFRNVGLLNRGLGATGVKDIANDLPWRDAKPDEVKSMELMAPVIDQLSNIQALLKEGAKPDADHPACALNKVDKAQRNAFGQAVVAIRAAVGSAAGMKPKPKDKVEAKPGLAGVPGGGTAGDLEARMKAKAVTATFGTMYDGNNAVAPVDPGANASAADKLKYDDAKRSWDKYQTIQGGRIVTEKDGSKSFVGGNNQVLAAGIPDGAQDKDLDKAAGQVKDALLNGDIPRSKTLAAEAAILPGGAPVLRADGVIGPGSATGLQSDRPTCGSDKLTQSDYEKKLANEKKKKSASRSADRQAAEKDYLDARTEADSDLEKCSNYGDASRRIQRDAATVKKCRETYDKAIAEADRDYQKALKKYGTTEALSAEAGAADSAAKTEAEKGLRVLIVETVESKKGRWRAWPESALAYAKDTAAREWAEPQTKDTGNNGLIARFFRDQWPVGPKFNKKEGQPDNPTYESNLQACLAKGMRTDDDDRVVEQCIGPSFRDWLENQIAAAPQVGAPKTLSAKDAARKTECKVYLDETLKGDTAKLPADCKALLGVK